MNLYHVQFDGQSYYVEAPSFARAVAVWEAHVKVLWGQDYVENDVPPIEPESVHLVHDEPVIR